MVAFLFTVAAVYASGTLGVPGQRWLLWPLLGWGLGATLHTVAILYEESLTGGEQHRYAKHGADRPARAPAPAKAASEPVRRRHATTRPHERTR